MRLVVRSVMVGTLLAVRCGLVGPPLTLGDGTGGDPTPPPVHVPGSREVRVTGDGSTFEAIWSIPGGSALARAGGGTACAYVADRAEVTSDGQHVEHGIQVTSEHWVFVEQPLSLWGGEGGTTPSTDRGPLARAHRWFFAYCDRPVAGHFLGGMLVPATDPVIDPRPLATQLRRSLQVPLARLADDPVVARWGQLLTRHPVWLGADPAAWAPSEAITSWRGWDLRLRVRPSALDVAVAYVPAALDGAPLAEATHVVVPCVSQGDLVDIAGGAVPARAPMPEQAAPSSSGRCWWTPPAPGTFVATPRITYDVELWASGFTEDQPDEVVAGLPMVRPIGTLSSVVVTG